MAATFFFYDLETSGFSASKDRIMQFAGIRTNADLEPIGEPENVLIKLAPDVLPSPDAIMLTGITPQATITEGLTEAEFLQYFYKEIVQPETTFLGFNTVRFDDEFMRHLHYRNFYDPYEWQWANGCSRWDILDVVRMTRALRPEGIEWPVTDEGKPTNRLELLTKLNGLEHEHAHDALSDVYATIAVAKIIRDSQPDLFNYLFNCRSKKQVASVVTSGQPFIYTSGRYAGEYLHTTAVIPLAKHAQQDAVHVYDLRCDPTPFLTMTPEQLVEAWQFKKDRDPNDIRLPVKTLKFNRCPAIAPLGVIKDEATQQRIQLTLDDIFKNLEILKSKHQAFSQNVLTAVELMNQKQSQAQQAAPSTETVDSMLYDGFISNDDKQQMSVMRAADPTAISDIAVNFKDDRLRYMAPLYKARNFPAALTDDERQAWEAHVAKQLFTGDKESSLAHYFGRLQELAASNPDSNKTFLLEELQLYGESIMPTDSSQG